MPSLRFAIICALAPVMGASAQGRTKELLDRGIALYGAFNVEQAQPLFQQIISPSNPTPPNAEERVKAYKYLGASYALLGKGDSAVIYFGAALEFDPFTDLEQEIFSAAELGPFATAKRTVFRVGIRPIYSALVDPKLDSTQYRFDIVATHRARVIVDLVRQPDTTLKENLFTGDFEGLKQVRWDGFMKSVGRIADSANYVLRVNATSLLPRTPSQGPALPATETQFLKVEHWYEPLEDTLPTLPDSMLLVETIPVAAPWFDLAKGVLFGAGAYGVAAIALNTDIKWQLHAILAVAVSAGSGVASWLYRSKNRSIPAAVAENVRRQQQRKDFNDGVVARNNARTALTKLIITPITAGR